MFKIAIEMLMGDRIKYTILISALAFSTLLITQQFGVFIGVMFRTTSLLINTPAKIWVVDPNVDETEFPFNFKESYLDIVRSVPGVQQAWPLLNRETTATVYGGPSLSSNVIGVDTQTLTGVPSRVISGNIEDLRQPNSVALDLLGANLLSKGLDKPLAVGDIIIINEHEEKIVAILETQPSFSSSPHIYMTRSNAIDALPRYRYDISYIMVEPEPNVNVEDVIKNIDEKLPLKAYTSDQFSWKTLWWIAKNTGIVMSFATTIILGFLFGIAVSGQTFYSFVYENSGNFAALKAMGISKKMIALIVFAQVLTAGFVGYGIGLFFTTLFAVYTLYQVLIPFYLNYYILLFVFLLIILICFVSASFGLHRINKLSPAEVFRA